MPHTVLHLYYGGFRMGVVCPADPGMLHVPVEHAFASSALALAELGLLIDTALYRMESNTWPEGPALEEIIQYQQERRVDKLNTLATLLIEREPYIADETHEGTKPGGCFWMPHRYPPAYGMRSTWKAKRSNRIWKKRFIAE
ncbi:hypothetical protein RN347_15165 [Halomonas sp. PAMB 3264]|uniref:hypothetical protein n=1 Tax=Halomonas sp. PAMB 3264 TaxID=3075222 RepID=UPI0028A17C1F|nr:hypothetical protein [Halomonas sp. PAMB 3264]WNL41946.1 hypothetical protein RN347_15165 [Halomonas sp. PAMB 3264]